MFTFSTHVLKHMCADWPNLCVMIVCFLCVVFAQALQQWYTVAVAGCGICTGGVGTPHMDGGAAMTAGQLGLPTNVPKGRCSNALHSSLPKTARLRNEAWVAFSHPHPTHIYIYIYICKK